MNLISRCFFLNREIFIYRIIGSMNLAEVSYVDDDVLFFVDLNFVSSKIKKRESSLSLAVLGGIV